MRRLKYLTPSPQRASAALPRPASGPQPRERSLRERLHRKPPPSNNIPKFALSYILTSEIPLRPLRPWLEKSAFERVLRTRDVPPPRTAPGLIWVLSGIGSGLCWFSFLRFILFGKHDHSTKNSRGLFGLSSMRCPFIRSVSGSSPYPRVAPPLCQLESRQRSG